MARKEHMDAIGALSLIGFSALLGYSQVVIKVVNAGLQPVFFAGLRSLIAVVCIWGWMRFRGRRVELTRAMLPAGLLIGLVFSAEFIFLFLALDLTSVARSSVIFYSMPLWLALAAHVLLPNERITPVKAVGLLLAFSGVAWALLYRETESGRASLAGDLCALGAALSWAGIALCARATRLNRIAPEMQLFWQVLVSAPVLLLAAPLFGPLIRDLQPVHLWGLAFQAVIVVSAGFMFWLTLLGIYPAASVASFGFLSPMFGVGFGWLLLDEAVGPAIIGALVLVALGIVLINRRLRPPV